MRNQGCFISFEGIDGSGKTTLVEQIRRYLMENGYTVNSIREPGGTVISEKIRGLLLDAANQGIKPWTEAILYGAARRQLVEESIMPAIQRGEIILADRYVDSTLAYQGYGRGLDRPLLEELNQICTGGIMPDLTLLLDIPAETAAMRRESEKSDRLEMEGISFQEKVRTGYLETASRNPARIHVMDASQSQGTVFRQAITMVEEYLLSRKKQAF